jgi:hypothetical protein
MCALNTALGIQAQQEQPVGAAEQGEAAAIVEEPATSAPRDVARGES